MVVEIETIQIIVVIVWFICERYVLYDVELRRILPCTPAMLASSIIAWAKNDESLRYPSHSRAVDGQNTTTHHTYACIH